MQKRDLINSTLTEILAFLNENPEVEIISDSEDIFNVVITGDNLNYLIGHHGSSLEALQNLLSQIVFKRSQEPTVIVIDINGYRKKREEKIHEMTRSFIDRVRFFKNDVPMPTMTPWERRQVHILIAEYDDISSESTGEGRDRRVVLKPKGSA